MEPARRKRGMQDRIAYFKRVTAIHDEAVRRLVESKDICLDELASFFEDIGRFYLDISEDIRDKTTAEGAPESLSEAGQSISPPPPKACLAEDPVD